MQNNNLATKSPAEWKEHSIIGANRCQKLGEFMLEFSTALLSGQLIFIYEWCKMPIWKQSFLILFQRPKTQVISLNGSNMGHTGHYLFWGPYVTIEVMEHLKFGFL